MPGMREALEAAYEQAEESATDDGGFEAAAVEDSTSSEEGTQEVEGVAGAEDSVIAPEEQDAESTETKGADEGTEAVSGQEGESGAEEAEESAGESEQASDYSKAPVGWRASAREHWAKLPDEIKQEVHRREANIRDVLRETADQRKMAESFQETLRPFEPLIASQNSDPVTATRNLFQTAAGLTLGTQQQKAQIIANVIKQYGVEIGVLDDVLSAQINPGAAGAAGDPSISRLLDEKLQPIQQFMTEVQKTRQTYQQESEANLKSEFQKFAEDPKNEFFEDVRLDMADILELAANRNQAMTLEQAYQRAVQYNPEVQKTLKQRQEAEELRKAQDDVAAKEAASSSLESQGSSPRTDKPTTLRGALEDAWDQAT